MSENRPEDLLHVAHDLCVAALRPDHGMTEPDRKVLGALVDVLAELLADIDHPPPGRHLHAVPNPPEGPEPPEPLGPPEWLSPA